MKLFNKKVKNPKNIDITQPKPAEKNFTMEQDLDTEVGGNHPFNTGIWNALMTVAITGGSLTWDYANFYTKDLKYLSNLFAIKGCEHIEKLSTRFLSQMIQAGAVALKKGAPNGELDFTPAVQNLFDNKQDIVEAIAVPPITFMFGSRKEDLEKMANNYLTPTTHWFCKSGTAAVPLIIKANSYYMQQLELKKIIYYNKRAMVEQFHRVMNQESSATSDMEALHIGEPMCKVINYENGTTDSRSEVAYVNGVKVKKMLGDLGVPNQFTMLPKNKQINADALETYYFIENVKNDIVGIRYNAEAKKSRNITSEVANSTIQFDLAENDMQIEIERFIEQRNKGIVLGETCCDKEWRVEKYKPEIQAEQKEQEKIENEKEEN